MTRNARHRRSAAALAAAAVVGVSVAACGGDTQDNPPATSEPPTPTTPFVEPTATTSRVPATPPTTPIPAPSTLPASVAGVDRENPDAVAEALAQVWYSWDTTTDLSPYDARLRSVPLLDDALATSIQSFPPIAGPGADWLDLTARSAVLTVGPDDVRLASETGAPPDTDSSAARLLTVTQRVSTPNGPLPDRNLVVGVVMVHGQDGWQISKVVPR